MERELDRAILSICPVNLLALPHLGISDALSEELIRRKMLRFARLSELKALLWLSNSQRLMGHPPFTNVY